jgi:hypothetical protein
MAQKSPTAAAAAILVLLCESSKRERSCWFVLEVAFVETRFQMLCGCFLTMDSHNTARHSARFRSFVVLSGVPSSSQFNNLFRKSGRKLWAPARLFVW